MIVNVVRFTIDPVREREMRDCRTALVAAARTHTSGLRRTVLTRVDDRTWMDVWLWESPEHLQATQEARLPEAAAAFAMVDVIDGTMGTVVVDE